MDRMPASIFRNNNGTSEKKRTIETNFFENKHTSAERTAQTMDDCKICLENKYSVA